MSDTAYQSTGAPEPSPAVTTGDSAAAFERQRSALLSAIVEASDDAILSRTLDGTVTSWNPAAERMFGYTAEEIIGTPGAALFPYDRLHEQDAMFGSVRRGIPTNHFETVRLHKNGTSVHVSVTVSPIKDTAGQPIGTAIIVRDIGEIARFSEALRESEQRLQTVLSAGIMGIWEVDLFHRKAHWSAQIAAILGRERREEEVSLEHFMSLVVEEDRAGVREAGRRAIAQGTPYEYAYRVVRADGAVRWVQINGRALYDRRGHPVRLVGVIMDVSDRKQEEEQLRLLSTVVEESSNSIMVTDTDDRIVYVNSAFERMTGFISAELLGMHRSGMRLHGPETAPDTLQQVREAMADERPISVELINYRKSGERFWVEVHVAPVRDKAGTVTHFVAIANDITSRKQDEEEVRLLSTVAEECLSGIIIADPEERIVYVNPAFERASGYTLADLQGQRPRDTALQGPLTAPETRRRIQAAVAAQEPISVELVYYHKNGTPYWIEKHITPVLDKAGRLTHFVSVENDITERKRADESLATALAELECRNWELVEARDAALAAARMKSEFLANTSHELRTPLNGVTGMADLLLNTPLSANQLLFAQTIKQSAANLVSVINDILDFSKMESGSLTIENADLSLCDLIEDVAALMAPRAIEKKLEISCDLPPRAMSSPWGMADHLKGDPDRIRQILVNLLGNAIKFTQAGEVVIGAELLSETVADARWRISVRDTGIGIRRDRQEMIFESFTQADGSTTRRYGGTGLGLTICRQLAALMNAKLGVTSKVSLGSTFWMEISLNKQLYEANIKLTPERDAMLIGGIHAEPTNGIHVLVADDSATVRRCLSRILRAWGCTVSEAANGQEVKELQTAGSGRPHHLLLVDLLLPGLCGVDLVRYVRSIPQVAPARIVFLAPLGTPTPPALAGDAAVTYLFKPIRQQDLMNCLRTTPEPGSVVAVGASPERSDAVPVQQVIDTDARLLLADDNPISQMVIQRLLAQFGFHDENVTAVSSGQEALAALAAVGYDLVLMDLHMHEIDAVQATRLIREGERNRCSERIPIVALTARITHEDRERCLASGVDDFVARPVEMEQLGAVLKRWLPAKGDSGGLAPVTTSPTLGMTTADSPIATPGALPSRWDRARLAAISGGDHALERGLMQELLISAPKMLMRCRLAIEMADGAGVEHWAHTFKGSNRTLGMMQLGDLCEEMERCGKESAIDRADILLPTLEHEWVHVEELVRSWLYQEESRN